MNVASGSSGPVYRTGAPDPVLYRWAQRDRGLYHVGIATPFVSLLVLAFIAAAFSGNLMAIVAVAALLLAWLRIVRPSVRGFEHEVLLRERSISWGRADKQSAQPKVYRSDVAKVLMDRGGAGSASRLIIVNGKGQLVELPHWIGSEEVLEAVQQYWQEVEVVRPRGSPRPDFEDQVTDEDG